VGASKGRRNTEEEVRLILFWEVGIVTNREKKFTIRGTLHSENFIRRKEKKEGRKHYKKIFIFKEEGEDGVVISSRGGGRKKKKAARAGGVLEDEVDFTKKKDGIEREG